MGRAAFLVIATCVLLLGTAPLVAQEERERAETMTRAQVAAVVLAVEDEVYDYLQAGTFRGFGKAVGGASRLPLYVHLTVDGDGEVIYMRPPYGEVVRVFHFLPGGRAVFDHDAEFGFPVTQPSYFTEFMGRSELRDHKARWLRGEFTIVLRPERSFAIQAARRQKARTGFSYLLDTPFQVMPKVRYSTVGHTAHCGDPGPDSPPCR